MKTEAVLTAGHSKKMIVWLIYVAVFFLPLSTPVLDIALLTALALSVKRCCDIKKWEWKTGPFFLPMIGFLLCALISTAFSKSPSFSFYNFLLLPCTYAVLYILTVTYIRTENEEKILLCCFFTGAICVAAYGFYQYTRPEDIAAWVDPERFPLLRRRMYSTLENPNLLSSYMLMASGMLGSFMLMERQRLRKLLLAVCFCVFLVCILLTYSRGAWVSLAVMVMIAALAYDRRIALSFLLLPIMLLFYHGQITERFLSLFAGYDTSTELRLALIESTVAMIGDHPLTGVGWGTYFLAYPEYNFYIQDADILIFHAHNMYLSIMSEIGIPGAACYFCFFFGHGLLAWRLYRNAKNNFLRASGLGALLAIAGTAVGGIGDYTLFARSISLCFWGICAFTAVCAEQNIKIQDSNTRHKIFF